jgi:hypothetical protein
MQEEFTTPENFVPEEPTPEVVDHVFGLPFQSQLGVLRTIAPKILARLAPAQRTGFLRDLNDEIAKAERGEASYDIRPGHAP